MENFQFYYTLFLKRYVFRFFIGFTDFGVCNLDCSRLDIAGFFLHGLFVDSLGKFDPCLPLGLIKQWYFVTKIVVIYCEKRLF